MAQASADLPPGVPTTVSFTATPQNRGWLSGVVQIEDDAFPFDNERYFSVHVPARRRVLVVRGEGQDTDFLELALSPELGRGRVAFDTETIPETALAAANLGSYDAVMMVGPQSLSSGEVAAIQRYVAGGGGLFLTPAEGTSGQNYNNLMEAINAGSISGFSGDLDSGRSIAAFERVEVDHPLFEGVFSRRALGDDRRIESPDIYFVLNYVPGTGGEQTLIRLSTGFPFLQEIRYDRGVVFLLAVAPDARWSDLPVSGLFIPLVYRSMYYLTASESVSGEQMTVATDAELRVPRGSEVGQLRLVGPDGTEYVPEQRDLFGAALLMIEGSAVDHPGIYDVRAGASVVRRIPFNIDDAESDLSLLDNDDGRDRLAASIGAPVELIVADGRPARDVVASVAQQRTGVELWNLFLLLALLFLVAEAVVARQWRPETVPA